MPRNRTFSAFRQRIRTTIAGKLSVFCQGGYAGSGKPNGLLVSNSISLFRSIRSCLSVVELSFCESPGSLYVILDDQFAGV